MQTIDQKRRKALAMRERELANLDGMIAALKRRGRTPAEDANLLGLEDKAERKAAEVAYIQAKLPGGR